MDLVGTKIVVLTLLGAIRLAFGLLPLKITKRLQLWGEQPASSHRLVQRRRTQVDRAISLCLCFGGGVLLATCFIHMLPEARESLEAARRAGASLVADDQFPFAELFICVGFFLVYIIEEVAHRVFLHHGAGPAAGDAASSAPVSALAKSSAPSGDKSAIAHAVTVPMPVAPAPAAQCCATVESELQRIEAVPVANGDGAGDPERGPPPWSRPRSTGKIAPATSQVHLLASTLSLEQKEPAPGAVVSTMHHHHYHHHSHGHHHHHHHHHHSVPSNPESSVMGHLRSMLVVLALSFHSVFEGLAIGLQPTPRDVWYLFTAVSIHASAILFCVGLELVMSGMRLLTMLAYLSVLTLVSPLGVVLGIVVTSAGSGDGGASVGQTLAVGVLQGVAGGTILYITFFEVLEREKKRADSAGLLRLACVLAGFAVMVALQLVGGHQHGEESDHHVMQAAANASTTEASHAHS